MSKEIAKDMTGALTKVDEKVSVFNQQVSELNKSQDNFSRILSGVKTYGTLAEFGLGALLLAPLGEQPVASDFLPPGLDVALRPSVTASHRQELKGRAEAGDKEAEIELDYLDTKDIRDAAQREEQQKIKRTFKEDIFEQTERLGLSPFVPREEMTPQERMETFGGGFLNTDIFKGQ